MHHQKCLFLLPIIILFLGCSAGGIGSTIDAKSGTTTTVILIRHAERDNFFTLTARGRQRAQALISAAGDMGITAIYSPDIERDLDTIKPLANHLGLKITLTPRLSKPIIDQLVNQILTEHTGEVVLLVGNGSGNLRALHHRLGGSGEGPYPYGQLFIYTIPHQGPGIVVKSRYGP